MSGPVAAIAYILRIPPVLGILFSVVLIVGIAAVQRPHETAAFAAKGILGGLFGMFGIASFFDGPLGWLLVMKRPVRECNCCRTVVNAG